MLRHFKETNIYINKHPLMNEANNCFTNGANLKCGIPFSLSIKHKFKV